MNLIKINKENAKDFKELRVNQFYIAVIETIINILRRIYIYLLNHSDLI